MDLWVGETTHDWGAIPAEPILYFFSFCAVLIVVLTFHNNEIGFERVGLGQHFSVVWKTLGLIAPLLALVAWHLVRKRTGKWRYFGMWLRLVVDLLQLSVMIIFIGVRTALPGADWGDDALYTLGITLGAATFVFMLVVRDVWTLATIENIATHLENHLIERGPGETRFESEVLLQGEVR